MKYRITVEADDEFEREAILHAIKNKTLVDGLYDDVFRPVVKYGESEEQVKLYLEAWDKVREYFGR